MQTIEVRLWDDLHAKDGERVPGDTQVELTVKTKKGVRHVRLDLTAAHAEELEKVLAPWIEAGQVPGTPASHGKPGSAQAREFYAGLRTWAAEVGRSEEHWTSGKGGHPRQFYYPKRLIADYEAFLAGKAAA
jgi:Lsr2 protein